jgi:hypothetical protein
MTTIIHRKLKQETLRKPKIMKLKIAGLLLGALTLSIAAPAKADNLSDQMNQVFSANSGDLFYNTTTWRQAQLLLNTPTVEGEYNKDSQAMEALYRAGMKAQTGTPISTADLPNPFNTSINTNPRLLGR